MPGNDQSNEIVDLNELLQRLDGDLDFLEELLAMFRQEFPVLLRKLEGGIVAEDFIVAERAAHTLKGMLANLAMPEAASTARRIEMAARAHSLSDTAEALPPLQVQVLHALELVEDFRIGAR
jgi:HPt (histidine-containing phosphotransfer) domain-containing protein